MSKHIYSEWLLTVADYYECLKKNEKRFEIFFPIFSAIVATVFCMKQGVLNIAINRLSDTLPTVFSILIGFTITAIAIISSVNGKSDHTINVQMGRLIKGKSITFRQWFLTNLIYYTICEIAFLILTFALPLVKNLTNNAYAVCVGITFIFSYSLLRLPFGIVKVVTKLYQVFFKDTVDQSCYR